MFDKLIKGLQKTRTQFAGIFTKVDESIFDDLEEALIMADVGTNTTMEIVDELRAKVKEKRLTDPQEVQNELKQIIINILGNRRGDPVWSPVQQNQKRVILIIGVNGVGKTTSIGKLAHLYKNQGKKVMLAAADTFRAAAAEQLTIWAERAGVPIVKQHEGADAASVVFDAITSAKAKNIDVLICDTAGRLHNKQNLMDELAKIVRVIKREMPEAKNEVLLVLDATTGQNAVSQAKAFGEVSEIDGIVLTKLDGTAKGGIVIALKTQQGLPVRYVGVGEGMEDFMEFDEKEFVDALL